LFGRAEYDVRGRVVGFGDNGRTIIVEHEDVPGLMPAMTMPFQAATPDEVSDLEYGDAVRFTLVLTRDSTWIYDVVELPPDALPSSTARSSAPSSGGNTVILQPGDPVPDFTLTSQDDEMIRLSDYKGKALLLTFIYTRCPIPNYCPLMSRNFAQLQPALKERYPGQVQLLSISFDPSYDTPEILREYAQRYTRDTDTWHFATGEPEEIDRIALAFGVFTERQDTRNINHTLTTALIGPDGRLRSIWRGNHWIPEEVMEEVDQVLRTEPDAS
jgi:protein SCO1/2